MLTFLLSVLFALVSVTFTRRQFVALMRAWHELQRALLHRHEQDEQYQREQIAEQARRN